jgi:hypothetical protein
MIFGRPHTVRSLSPAASIEERLDTDCTFGWSTDSKRGALLNKPMETALIDLGRCWWEHSGVSNGSRNLA